MPGISLLVIVIGLVALAGYLATGFMQGRQNRKPLERDSITESTAKALSPLTEEKGIQGSERNHPLQTGRDPIS